MSDNLRTRYFRCQTIDPPYRSYPLDGGRWSEADELELGRRVAASFWMEKTRAWWVSAIAAAARVLSNAR